MTISPARIAAFDVLRRLESGPELSSALLAEAESDLSRRDAALCHTMVLGVLRRRIYLDRVIEQLAGRRRLDEGVRISLQLGLFQILHLDRVPDHSAVNESVMLVRRAKLSSAAGFVNALLRKAIRERPEPAFSDDLDRISVATSHPRWLLERWSEFLGPQQAEALAAANNEPPGLSFRVVRNALPGNLAAQNRPSATVEGSFLADSMTDDLDAAAQRGEIYFQDEGSQLVGSAVEIPAGGVFLDVCAAPGSKTTQIASRAGASGARIFAGDQSESRVATLTSILERTGNVGKVRVVRYDAETSLPFADEVFDTVLVDAPCTGTGTIRHNPEIRYRVRPEDIAASAAKQLAILINASKLVKAGGVAVYSTCSIEPEENESVIERFLANMPGFEAIRPNVPDKFIDSGTGFARTYPHRDGVDGFFVAALKRVA